MEAKCLCGRLLHGDGVEGHAHGREAIVDIDGCTGSGAREGRQVKGGSSANVVAVQVLRQGGVGLAVVDGVVDEGLGRASTADGLSWWERVGAGGGGREEEEE